MYVDAKSIVFIDLFGSFYADSGLCFIASISDTVSSDNSSQEALNADTTKSNALRRILMAFSWKRNFAILFSESPKNCISDVIEISGLRVLCLLWILLVHICTVLYYVAGKIRKISRYYFLFFLS